MKKKITNQKKSFFFNVLKSSTDIGLKTILTLLFLCTLSACKDSHQSKIASKYGVVNDGVSDNVVQFSSRQTIPPKLRFPPSAYLFPSGSVLKNKEQLNLQQININMIVDHNDKIDFASELNTKNKKSFFRLSYEASNGITQIYSQIERESILRDAVHREDKNDLGLTEYGLVPPSTEKVSTLVYLPMDRDALLIDGSQPLIFCGAEGGPLALNLLGPPSCRLSFIHPTGLKVTIYFPFGLISYWNTVTQQVSKMTTAMSI